MLNEIIINGKKYLEQLNVHYNIVYNENNLKLKIKPNFKEDEDERIYIISRVKNELIPLLKKDNNTRQACFSILYPNGLGHCISLIQILLRNKTIILNEYYRSQNYSINKKYDDQTAQLIINEVLKSFKDYKTEINVFVASYHEEIE